MDGDWSDIPMAVKPRQLRRFTGRGGVVKYAATMPYPSLDGTEPCVGKEELYLSDDVGNPSPDRVEACRNLCASCPRLVACREWAIAHENDYVWGGMTAAERRTERKRRRQVLVNHMGGDRFGFNTTFFPELEGLNKYTSEQSSEDRFVSSVDLWDMGGPDGV